MRKWMIVLLTLLMLGSVLLSTAAAVYAESIAALPISPVPITPISPIVPIVPVIPIDPALLNQRTVKAIPLYRLERFITGPAGTLPYHLYTTSESERTYWKALGWVDDAIVLYVSPVSLPGTLPLRRWRLANRTDFLTMDPSSDAGSYGYYPTGYIGYVFPPVTPGALPSGQSNAYRYSRVMAYPPFTAHDHIYDRSYPPAAGLVPSANYQSLGPKFRGWSSGITLQKVTVEPFASGLTGKSKVMVRWNTQSPSGYVEIMFSSDGGTNYSSVVKGVAASAYQYEWEVPNIASDKCYIMVRWSSTSTTAATAWSVGAKFTITRNLMFAVKTDFSLIPLLSLPPAAPTALLAIAGATTPLIQLSWEDNSPNEEGFLIQRKAEGGTYADLHTAAANAVGYGDTTVSPGVQYTYRVKALGSGTAIDSVWSDEASAAYYPPETDPEDMAPETTPATIAPPANLAGVEPAGSPRQVRLSWTASPSVVLGYAIERRTTGDWAELTRLADPAAITYTDTSISDATLTQASYRVLAIGELADSAPSNEVTVALTTSTTPPEPEPPTPGPEFDGSQSDWAEAELTLAFQNGLTYPGVMYEFGRKITREEFCTIAVKLYEKLSGTAAAPGADPFDDTDNPDILKAYALGIVRGISANLFAPGNNITRQEICVMIFRALQAAGETTALAPGAFPFDDAGAIAPWAINEVKFCYQNEIMRGMSPTTIVPLGNTTREQAIALLYRTYAAFK